MDQKPESETIGNASIAALRRRIAQLEKLDQERRQTENIQSALYRIADAASSAADMTDLYGMLHRIVGHLMVAKNFYIALYDETSQSISFPYFVDEFDQPPQPRNLSNGLTEYVLTTGSPLLVSRERYQQLITKGRIDALHKPPVFWLGIPLKKRTTTFGVLTVQSYHQETCYTEKDKELLTFVSQHIATALQRKQAEEALKRNEQKLQNLSKQMEQFSLAAASTLSLKDEQTIFDKISAAIVKYSDYQRVIISLFKETQPYREIIGYGGVDDETIATLRNIEMPKQWYDEVFEKGEKIGLNSYYIPHTLKHILNQEATICGESPIRQPENYWHPEDNLFVVMHDHKGELIGIISVDESKSGFKPSDETVRPLEIFSSLISQIIIIKKEQQERKKLEAQLRQSQKIEAIGTLAGGIAHDFNNILGIILGNAELVLEDIPDSNPAHFNLKEIKSAGLRAADIVRQLLNFSRQTDQVLRPVGYVSIIKETLQFLRSTIPATIDIRKQIPAVDCTILADPIQINQIMMNLCINASQAMEKSGGTLEIRVGPLALDQKTRAEYPDLRIGDYIKTTVSDTGPGIEADIIERIFDPYFTTKEIGKGSGMGLAVVLGIVKNHNGAISVKSRVGKGTTFSILFPVISEQPAPEAITVDDLPLGSESILFVDDEASIVTLTGQILKKLGYRVEALNDPLEALRQFQRNPQGFDLVITDMTMPQMTGVALSQKLKQIRPDIPIVICTGHSSLIDEEDASKLGIGAYVMKPIMIKDMAKTVRKVLDGTGHGFNRK